MVPKVRHISTRKDGWPAFTKQDVVVSIAFVTLNLRIFKSMNFYANSYLCCSSEFIKTDLQKKDTIIISYVSFARNNIF